MAKLEHHSNWNQLEIQLVPMVFFVVGLNLVYQFGAQNNFYFAAQAVENLGNNLQCIIKQVWHQRNNLIYLKLHNKQFLCSPYSHIQKLFY